MKLILKPNEMIIRVGDSRLLGKNGKICGKLIVTNQRIYFVPMKTQTGDSKIEILPGEIEELYFFNTFRMIPNGMDLKTKKGVIFHFTISRRREWAKLITGMF